MVEGSNDGGFITAVPGQSEAAMAEESKQQVAIRDDSEEYQSSQDEDEREEDQQFHVDGAEPPTNYDDAYSDLPAKIKLQNIKVRS